MDALVSHAPISIDELPHVSRGRRAAATIVDVVTALGSPWIVFLISIPLLVVTALWMIPALFISIVATLVLWFARRQRNGDRLTAGQLVTRLAVVRAEDSHRMVLAADAPEAMRPSKRRLIAGTVAFALVASMAAVSWGSGIYVYWAVNRPEMSMDGGVDPEWQAQEPGARLACDEFVSSLLSSDPRGGERYVTGEAAKILPLYRERIRREGVTALQQNGSGQGSNEWEYMFVEQNPVQAGSHYQRSVSIQVQKVDGRFVVTQIAPNEMYSDDAYDAPAEAATETTTP
jgi:hypothetical protein